MKIIRNLTEIMKPISITDFFFSRKSCTSTFRSFPELSFGQSSLITSYSAWLSLKCKNLHEIQLLFFWRDEHLSQRQLLRFIHDISILISHKQNRRGVVIKPHRNPEVNRLDRLCICFVTALVWKWNHSITSHTLQGVHVRMRVNYQQRRYADATLREPLLWLLHLHLVFIVSGCFEGRVV